MTGFKSMAVALAVGIYTVTAGFSGASATIIDANWFSNATTVVNVIDPPGPNGPERLRLQGGFNSGFVEGTVMLGSVDDWTISATIRTDGQFDIPTEYVRIFIDDFTMGSHVAEFLNTPSATSYFFSHSITGDQFNYRFEFFSPEIREDAHLIVGRGTVASPMPEPGTLAIVGFGLIGLSMVRRRRALR